jgi:26S proteasome regulatory subunit T1
MSEEHPLQVARCMKIIPVDPSTGEAVKAVNPLEHYRDKRVPVNRTSTSSIMSKSPSLFDVTYSDVDGCKEQIEKLREVIETPLLSVSGVPRYHTKMLSAIRQPRN